MPAEPNHRGANSEATLEKTTIASHATTADEKSGCSFTRSTGNSEVDDSQALDTLTPAVVSPDGNGGSQHERTASDIQESSVPIPKNKAMISKARMQVFACCFIHFIMGWDGATLGPLIPRFQTFYGVDYAIVALVFVTNAIGFLLGAGMNVYLIDKFGLGKVLVLGATGQIIAYALMAPGLPFPMLCVAYLMDGCSVSLQTGPANSFIASLAENSSAKMGLMHGIYGLGAVCAPFAATQFAQMPRLWSLHYLISLGLAVTNALLLLLVFKGRTQDECLREIGQGPTPRGTSKHNKYRQTLGQKIVHPLALFSLLYIGIEFTIGGWTVSYIQTYRGGGASSGYISTGFFAGLTIGRVTLLWVNEKVGEHLIIYIYILLAIGFELIAWLVPVLIVDGIAVSLAGFVLGPMYPILMNETGRLIPQWLLVGSISWIASIGVVGSALFPFITGLLAERFGLVSLQPVLIILLSALFGLWLLVPNGSRVANWNRTTEK